MRALRGAGVGVDADPVPQAAAQQVAYRHTELLAQDVPEGDLDTGHRPTAHHAGHPMPHHGQQHLLPEILDPARVLTNYDGGEVLDGRLDDARPAARLAKSVDAGVGLDFDEQPVAPTTTPATRRRRIHEERLDIGDLHLQAPWCPARADLASLTLCPRSGGRAESRLLRADGSLQGAEGDVEPVR